VFITSGSRGWKEFYSREGAMFLRSQDIRTDNLELGKVARVSPPNNSEGVRTRVRRGDILVTVTGANLAKAAVVRTELDEAYVSQHVGLIRLLDPDLKDIVHAYLIAPSGGRKTLLTLAYGAGKPGLNLDNLRTLPVPLPPYGERDRILASLERQLATSERLNAEISSRDKTAQRLRQAVLLAAFSGRLVHQDPNDEAASALLERIRAERAAALAAKNGDRKGPPKPEHSPKQRRGLGEKVSVPTATRGKRARSRQRVSVGKR